MTPQSILVRSGLAAAALSTALLAACSSSPPREGRDYTNPNVGTVSTTNENRMAQYGRITRIDTVQESRRGNVGVGTVLGAVVGGALGNQIGSGTGRTAATIAGAVGGGVAGNQVDRNRASNNVAGYEVYVRLENGDSRSRSPTQAASMWANAYASKARTSCASKLPRLQYELPRAASGRPRQFAFVQGCRSGSRSRGKPAFRLPALEHPLYGLRAGPGYMMAARFAPRCDDSQ
jgi:outer membrane lipoprotein SlyB